MYRTLLEQVFLLKFFCLAYIPVKKRHFRKFIAFFKLKRRQHVWSKSNRGQICRSF